MWVNPLLGAMLLQTYFGSFKNVVRIFSNLSQALAFGQSKCTANSRTRLRALGLTKLDTYSNTNVLQRIDLNP